MNAAALADALVEHCVDVAERFFTAHAPGARLPRVFAGHAVGADVRADVLFTLTHLAAAGVDAVAGRPIEALVNDLLREVDGAATHSFFSYRVAETLLDAGPFTGNARLAGLDARQRGEVADACDSSSFLALLEQGLLPRNYLAVLARCELDRVRLGLVADTGTVDELVARLRVLLTENPRHCLDDSHDRSGRYDIYTPDVWLFCEPLAELIGPAWRTGFAGAVTLVEHTVAPDGTSIPWGRSTGVLSIALTVELAAAAVALGVGDDPARWLRRGTDAAFSMRAHFGSDGVVDAHQFRDQDAYRGPARRVQLTFDLLGKLAWAARTLRDVDAPAVEAAARRDAYTRLDALVAFDTRTTAAVWTYRAPALGWSLPFVGPTRSHYLAAPVRPGLFEVPIDRDLPCWTPLVVSGYQRYVAGGLPVRVEHADGSVTAAWDGFVPTADTFTADQSPRSEPQPGTRQVTFRVEGRTLVVDDAVALAHRPQALSVAIPEIAARPLAVEFECDAPHAVSRIDVDGVAEWRSGWSQITRVHQLDVDPTTETRWTVRVTPKLRVASSDPHHHYPAALFEPLGDRVVVRSMADLAESDVFHLHWPEWIAFDDLGAHERILRRLERHGVPTVWTAHNLTPHAKQPERFDPVYARWARHVEAVIHHSEWGKQRMLARYEFAPGTEHVVLRHGHFGGRWAAELAGLDRARAEAALGLPRCGLRIGIVGAPRREKRTVDFARGVVACARDDVQLCVWSVGWGETLPADPRVAVAETYRGVGVATYATRLAACDVLALPFDPDGEMLATGTVADAIGAGIPVLGTEWGFLVEYLGPAMISIGHGTAEEVAAVVDALDGERLAAARRAMAALRPQFDWTGIAEATHALLDRVAQRGPSPV